MNNNYLKNILLGLSLLFLSTDISFGQCTIDVEIVEGTTIEMCQNALVPINATAGYVDYQWSGPISGASQAITPTISGQYIVNATDAVNCVSADTIQVTVFPLPSDAISSSAGDTICGGSTTLSLGNSYSMYSWTGGAATPTLEVTDAGTYQVNVVDANNCVATFQYKVEAVVFDLAIIGENSCINTTTLEASGGSSYQWSNGEATSTIVVSPEVETVYTVDITAGTCSQSLSITVEAPSDQPDFSLPDTFFVAANENLSISGPAGYLSYDWAPGNQILDSTVQLIVFNGTESQTITMTATHSDGCFIQETFLVVVVDLVVPNGISPNGDHLNDALVIPGIENYNGTSVVIWNRWGEIVYESSDYQNDWKGTCESGLCFDGGTQVPDGTYFYVVDVGGVQKEGYITILR